MTLAFIGLYKCHEHLFHRVNIKEEKRTGNNLQQNYSSSQVTSDSVSRSETCRNVLFEIEIPCTVIPKPELE